MYEITSLLGPELEVVVDHTILGFHCMYNEHSSPTYWTVNTLGGFPWDIHTHTYIVINHLMDIHTPMSISGSGHMYLITHIHDTGYYTCT